MKKKILIVDDDPEIQRMVGAMLDKLGHVVETASNGRAGLEKALHSKPDLIIADILMPVMDGWSFVDQLRAHQELMLIPVIFLSALDQDADRTRGYRLGAVEYLSKPFLMEELQERVETVLFKGAGLRGNIEQMRLSSVLTLLEVERKSGILVLTGDRQGRMFLFEGRVVDAVFDDALAPQGAEAAYEMLNWTVGEFAFFYKDVQLEARIDGSTTQLLIEAARQADETRRKA